MPHSVDVTGKIEKTVKRGGGQVFAVLHDTSSYIRFLIPNNHYVKGQTIRFIGVVTDTEKNTTYIRLMGVAYPPLGDTE